MAVTFETNDAAYIASSAAAIYTNAASETSFVKSIVVHNTNTTAENVKIHVVPDSGGSVGTAATSNLLYNFSLAADATIHLEFPGPGVVLKGTNDTVQAVTDTASKVTYFLSVRIDT